MPSQPIDTNDIEALKRRIAELELGQRANLQGSGAIAQTGGTAFGERSVLLEDNSGTVVTGTQVVNHYYNAVGGRLPKERIARQVSCYLGWLRERTQSIALRGIERAGGAPVVLLPIETAYVPLRARPMLRLGDLPGKRRMRGRKAQSGDALDGEPDPAAREEDIELDRVLGLGNRLVIVGAPGSGKTTVLLHLAWALASSLLTGQVEPARSRLGLAIPPGELPVPIFVPLASFARYRRNLPAHAPARDGTLAHFISHHLIDKQVGFDLPADFFVQLLKDGRDVLLLLDGLDEVANEDERGEVRQSVEDLASGQPAMRVVVTCRIVAYRTGRTALGSGFREIAVQPLDYNRHIVPMVRRAYACIHPQDKAQRDARSQDLLDAVGRLEEQRRERLGDQAEALVDSPLMVRLLLIVHVNERALPDERADLFDKAVNALLQVDYGLDDRVNTGLSTDWRAFREMAQHIAFHMHSQGPDRGREIEEPALRAALREDRELAPRIGDFLGQARQRGSLLEERNGVYRFIHLAFQEFLVARYLWLVVGAERRDAILAFIEGRLDDPWWREPILLLAGYMGGHAPRSARELLGALAKTGDRADARFSAAELAGTAALEWRESGAAIRGECAQRIAGLLADTDALAKARPVLRTRAGDALARLGDPRFDPRRFHLPADASLGLVQIPADPRFRIGTRRSDTKKVGEIIGYSVPDGEINDELTPTPAFYISRYPITVAQFRAFVDETGLRLGHSDALRNPDSRPVRYIDWHEATGYCRWLNEKLASEPSLAAYEAARLVREGTWQFDLPSELEWEKAARGELRDAVFPWGDEPDPSRANYRDTNIGDTSPVGCFPANELGLHDMIGNVWEWTRSRYAAYPYRAEDGREITDPKDDDFLVVRGGSWADDRVNACCACRFWVPPVLRLFGLGFRVVLRSAPVS